VAKDVDRATIRMLGSGLRFPPLSIDQGKSIALSLFAMTSERLYVAGGLESIVSNGTALNIHDRNFWRVIENESSHCVSGVLFVR
jgi:hypothetical protein